MTSYTSPDSLPYPDDYAASADVPSVFQSVATAAQNALILRAPLASPGLTGVPTAPTAATGTNSAQIATTAFVNAEIAADAPTKTGGGASGTWPINISGNAGTAGNADTVDGKHFHWQDHGNYDSYVWGGSDGVNMYVMPTWKFAKHDHGHDYAATGHGHNLVAGGTYPGMTLGAGDTGNKWIATGLASSPRAIVATAFNDDGVNSIVCSIGGVWDASGFTVCCRNLASSAETFDISWIAVM